MVVKRQDLVRWNGSGFSVVFDGSAEGLDYRLNIDGAQDLGGGHFLMSFDTTGEVGGVVFADEDIVRFGGGSWSIEFDASEADIDWQAADMDAFFVPEPSFALLVTSGVVLLGIRRIAAARLLSA